MSKDKILVVEDGPDISSLLMLYFTAQGYDVATASRGKVALEMCRQNPPNLVLLDVGLPDMEGYDVGKAIRANRATKHIPIIFLTAHGERKDRLKGLGEVQAQYYIVKPFDIEEVHMIAKNLLDDARRKNQRHPVTGLPTADLVNEQLRSLLNSDGWGFVSIRINGFDSFTQFYGSVAGEDVLKFLARILNETIDQLGTNDDFVGQVAVGPDFVLTASPDRIEQICEQVARSFDEGVHVHYAYRDRKRGYLEVNDDSGQVKQLPFMTLSMALLSSDAGPFADIRHLAEMSEELHARTPAADLQAPKSVINRFAQS